MSCHFRNLIRRPVILRCRKGCRIVYGCERTGVLYYKGCSCTGCCIIEGVNTQGAVTCDVVLFYSCCLPLVKSASVIQNGGTNITVVTVGGGGGGGGLHLFEGRYDIKHQMRRLHCVLIKANQPHRTNGELGVTISSSMWVHGF